jgi:hypothetical protein
MAEARDLGEGIGAFLTVVGVIYALIVGFTFQQSFARLTELRHKMTAEAGCLRNLTLLAGVMRAADRRPEVARHLLGYVERVLADEFPPSDSVSSEAPTLLYGVLPVLHEISADGAGDEVDRVTLDAIHEEIRSATRDRGERLTIALRRIPRVHWFQIELLSTLLVVGYLLLDLGAPLLEALLQGLTASAITVLYLSLFDLDYPFGGLWRVEPSALREIRDELRELAPIREKSHAG